MKGLLTFLLYASLLPFIIGFVQEAFFFLHSYRGLIFNSWFFNGVLIYSVSYVLFLKKHMEFLETFEHELAHAITGAFFFNKVQFFGATSVGYGAVITSREPNTIILLAPYFLPVFTLPLIFVRPFISSFAYFPVLDFTIGMTVAFHFIGVIKEFKAHQSDVQRVGMTISYLLVIFFNALFLVLIIAMVFADINAFFLYLRHALLQGILLYEKFSLILFGGIP